MSSNNKNKKSEVGTKTVPSNYLSTSRVAVQFAGLGISFIRNIPLAEKNTQTGEISIPLSESELMGRLNAGNLLYAQGLELLLKLALITEEISDSGLGQHDFVSRFEKIKSLEPLKTNIQIYMPKKNADKELAADKVVKEASDIFMPSRYIGFKKEDVRSINALDAAGLLLAITLSYKGMAQIEAAKVVGIDIKNKDGTPIVPERVIVEMKKD